MMILILSAAALFTIGFFSYKSYQKKQQQKVLKSGDIARLKSVYHKDYPFIPVNNVLHILDVDGEYVRVEYLNFKDGTYHKEKLTKDAIRKISRRAA
jgi:hypothetical protein